MDNVVTTVGGAASTFSPLGAIATGVGDIASSAMSLYGQQKQMDFQRNMANTAHQREVKDLKAAGLNPILSATGGSGSATPSGASLSVPDFSNVGASLTSARQNQIASQQSNTAARAQNSQSAVNQAQQDNLAAQTAKTQADTRLTMTQADNLALTSAALNKIPGLNAQLLQYSLPSAKAQADFYQTGVGHATPYVQSAEDAARAIGSLIHGYNSLQYPTLGR